MGSNLVRTVTSNTQRRANTVGAKRGYGHLPPTPAEIGEARVVLRVVVHRKYSTNNVTPNVYEFRQSRNLFEDGGERADSDRL